MTSKFKKYRITGPETVERKARAVSPAAKPLVAGEGPLAIRSGVMIHQMRQGLKKAIRALRGDLTQESFAQQIGVSQAALARVESLNNEIFPSTPMLIRIALVSGRDLQMSFVKRTEDASGIDAISAETAGFPSSSGLEDFRAVIEDYDGNRASAKDAYTVQPVHEIVEKEYE